MSEDQGVIVTPMVLGMSPGKMFFTSKFRYLIFGTPTHKTETGTANGGGGDVTNSKPPGLIIMMGQLETLSSNQIMFIALVARGGQRC
jgi:hypothetical protein